MVLLVNIRVFFFFFFWFPDSSQAHYYSIIEDLRNKMTKFVFKRTDKKDYIISKVKMRPRVLKKTIWGNF